MEKLTVMVTGAGAVLGQGILRSLRMGHRLIRIITADPDYRAAGHWLGDVAFTIPMANDPTYLSGIEKILARERVDILLIGTDVELPLFSRERAALEARYGTRIIVSSQDVIEIANDKLKTANYLESAGFPFAASAASEAIEDVNILVESVGFPLIAKPRHGARSVGLEIIRDYEELSRIMGRKDFVIQELLPDDWGEYTAGCLVFEHKCMATVVLRRDLRNGNTHRAYVDGDYDYRAEIASIAESLNCYGPCNFQFRVRSGKPVIFEINARFSGTTPIRAIFGFNEVIALLDYVAAGIPIQENELKSGAVFRAWSDIFVDSAQLERFRTSGVLHDPICAEYPFKSLK